MSAIPQQLKAADAVARQLSLNGTLPVADLPRLAAALSARTGALSVTLAFEPHALSRGRVRGTLAGELMLTCQRSLEPFAWTLDTTFDWVLVRDEAEEERLLQDGDPVLLEGDLFKLRDAIEDEALLALPLVPLSPVSEAASLPSEARKRGSKTKPGSMGDNVQLDDSRPNPFAALKGKLQAAGPEKPRKR